jgi:hypothetical protein
VWLCGGIFAFGRGAKLLGSGICVAWFRQIGRGIFRMDHTPVSKSFGIAALAVIAAGVCLGELAQAAVPFTVSKETTAIVGPLKGDGTVDYVAAINQIYGKGVTAENNGYVIWLRVVGTDALPGSVRLKTLAILGVAQQDLPAKGMDQKIPDDLPERPWKAEDNPEVAAYLTANNQFLDLAVEASQKPMWWDTAVSPDGTLGQVLLPSLNWLRGVSNALCSRALLREGQGDFDGFISDVMAVKRLSRLGLGWTMVSRLVCCGMDGLANRTISAVVANSSLTSAQCAQLAKELDGIAPLPELTDVVDTSERWSRLDVVTALAAGRLKPASLDSQEMRDQLSRVHQGDIDWDIVLRRMNQQVDDVVAIMRDPKLVDTATFDQAYRKEINEITARRAASKNPAKGAEESREAYSNRMADALVLATAPSMGKIVSSIRASQMRDEMVFALVAAAQFRADNSHWPGVLGDLVPKYLASVPRDIYSAGAVDPVRYIQSDAGIFIYSVGVNRIDDGGVE